MIARRWQAVVATDRADPERAVYYLEDDDFLVGDRETTVAHFRVPWAHQG
jgi:hypothetical protein